MSPKRNHLAGNLKSKGLFPAIVLMGIFVLTMFVYWPGLQGGFLFDDIANLEPLGFKGSVSDLETLRGFLAGGGAGPTGRPLSLISFLLDDNTWPTYAPLFKLTNLKIHLLVGALLCWNAILILRQRRDIELTEAQIAWVAVLSAGFWLLHPYFLSTTLYVVQRMAQLSALFVLLGMLGYLYGRSLLGGRPRIAYFWMSLSTAVCTLLAVLCKENGALLPILLLVLEFCFFWSPTSPKLNFCWKVLFLIVPTCAIFGYLFYAIEPPSAGWANRSFTQSERVLTEGRVLWEYIYDLCIPKIERLGLFQDGFLLSRGWLSPPSTLYAMLGVLSLIVGACCLRKKMPTLSFAILFFIAGHLLESTNLNLEIYFEHRNYLPAVFLFLPLAEILVKKGERYYFGIFLSILILAILSFMTFKRASLWADTNKLTLYWAMENPQSARGQNAIAVYLFEHGDKNGAINHLEKAHENFPESALLSVQLLTAKVLTHEAQLEDYLFLSQRLQYLSLDEQSLTGLMTMATSVGAAQQYTEQDKEGVLVILEGVTRNPKFGMLKSYAKQVPYMKGHVLLALDRPDSAYKEYIVSMELHEDPDSSLLMVGEMASSGNYALARLMLSKARELLNRQEQRTMRRSLQSYEKDFSRFEDALRESL